MALNLDRIGQVAERYMLDTITISRLESEGSMVMSSTTLELAIDRTTVYTGKAMVSPMGTPADTNLGGNVPVAKLSYEIAIPLGNEDIRPNDVVRITVSRDARLKDLELTIVGTVPGTFSVTRRFSAYAEVPAQ